VLHPKPKSDPERQNKKRMLVIIPTDAITRGAAVLCIDIHIPTSTTSTVTTPLSKVATAAVTRGIQMNRMTQLPSEATIKSESVIEKFVSRGLTVVPFVYNWASHRLTVCV
jgi:hypothetical protein